ncbi:uncharacterized protein LY89DRAFT_720493 [Mollisia scopiformis]|uniref:Uncharacterized protein n=1 Tax=Mollisia scopiformis TaxID=149040 RepID=A0A194X4J6_MOLSC|nr:uncharacterized protein LY89DRAFT_720493 [Mollisia scopiformis]KUJ15103.1 hypothetical protein LY89DRAFT_720493 [Mollisia scopiformis]
MDHYEHTPEEIEASPVSLRRSDGTTDFLKYHAARQRASRPSENSLSVPISRRSKSNVSENSQILYMSASKSSKRRRGFDRSLSSISNGGRRFDGSADEKQNIEATEEMVSQNIIDREIFEWQYVCQSGRPYWWSPESKYARLKKLQHKVASEYEPQIGTPGVDTASKSQYAACRRTVSDSYLADSGNIHDLAHLIAVQLLGACFTLPPDSITAVTPQYIRDEDGIAMVRDPRLISSLRMHTHFRYSPSFGHQARNTSPIQVWPGRFDGPKSGSSPTRSNTGCSTPNIGTSSPCSRRPRMHKTLHNTEGSGNRDEDEDYIRTCCDNNELDPTVGACAWYRRQGVDDPGHRSFTLPRMPSASNTRRPTHTPEGSKEEASPSRVLGVGTPKTNYHLQPVLRSESHHVFIQPVRELVVKRWRKFRRRLSGSLHSSLPTRTSEDAASASESSASEDSSQVMSSDAKARRLRAQERGDIHSSSMDSTPHYNTPKSGHLSPSNNDPARSHWTDSQSTTPNFRLADPLAAAASLVAAELMQSRSSGKSTPSRPASGAISNGISSRECQNSTASSALATRGSSPTRPELLSVPSSSQPNTTSSAYSFSSHKSMRRSRRRSMLSEVCTPEDLQNPERAERSKAPFERSALSAMGSRLASPMEEMTLDWPLGGRKIQGSLTSPGPSVLPTLAELKAFSAQERPRISRTSTSGTQIFTPTEEGVEIDGLPAGPPRDSWVGRRGRRERTYL